MSRILRSRRPLCRSGAKDGCSVLAAPAPIGLPLGWDFISFCGESLATCPSNVSTEAAPWAVQSDTASRHKIIC